jgi:hypothetical protein
MYCLDQLDQGFSSNILIEEIMVAYKVLTSAMSSDFSLLS